MTTTPRNAPPPIIRPLQPFSERSSALLHRTSTTTNSTSTTSDTTSGQTDQQTRNKLIEKIRQSTQVSLKMLIEAGISPASFCQERNLHPNTLCVASNQNRLLDASLYHISSACHHAQKRAESEAVNRLCQRPLHAQSNLFEKRNPQVQTPVQQSSPFCNTNRFASNVGNLGQVSGSISSPSFWKTAIYQNKPLLYRPLPPLRPQTTGPRFPFKHEPSRHSSHPLQPSYSSTTTQPPSQDAVFTTHKSHDVSTCSQTALNLCVKAQAQSCHASPRNSHQQLQVCNSPRSSEFNTFRPLNSTSTKPPNSDDVRTVSGYHACSLPYTNVPILQLQPVKQPIATSQHIQVFESPQVDSTVPSDVVQHNEMIRFIENHVPDVIAVELPNTNKDTQTNNHGLTPLGLTPSSLLTECIEQRHQELKHADANGQPSSYMQVKSSRVLKPETPGFSTGDKAWSETAPSLPPGFTHCLPVLKSDQAVPLAYHDVCSLETSSRCGQKIAADGKSALQALTALLPVSPMAKRLHNHVTTVLDDNVKLFTFIATSLFQLRRDVALTHSVFNERERFILRHSDYSENQYLLQPTMLRNILTASAERNEINQRQQTDRSVDETSHSPY